MIIFRYILFLLFGISVISSCKPKKDKIPAVDPKLLIYHGSQTILNDLVHTRLELKPDFAKHELSGTAFLSIEPHFYPVDSLILDAVYMRIESVEIISVTENKETIRKQLRYTYDSLKLSIGLDKRYKKEEVYTVVIKYVAQPDKIPSKGSKAITSRHGLYFINTDGKEMGKPIQMWTQGETQAASCWFPTIDAPNQKSSEEISVEVPIQFKSISNGAFIKSEKNSDSTRIDYWKQDLPHAPYLFALIIGDFAEIKDQWKNKQVHYYVEHEYEQYAKLIFGNTPEMLSFFSNTLGVEYPWDKFHQVVVRDFVSGAMENTGCVVHFDKLQHDSREHLDETYEDIIAHELFHHWFGDLVTCESWSNIPLNESFATYGEYLWDEYKYGRNEADFKLDGFHDDYLSESAYKSENLIRYFYGEQEEMFDAHSYQKGGSVLHMLRKYTGDDAFFKSLNIYLTRNQFKTVELSDLRKAFEEVTGEDLNWFFDQWFLGKGHPSIEVNHAYTVKDGYSITVIQKATKFRLPIDIDVYGNEGKRRIRCVISKDTQVIKLPYANEKSYVQFDAENQFLGEKFEKKSEAFWKLQFEGSKLAAHRIEAFNQMIRTKIDTVQRAKYCQVMIEDSFWYCRVLGINAVQKKYFKNTQLEMFAKKARTSIETEKVAAVRKAYVSVFAAVKDETSLRALLNDSSYEVIRKSLLALGQLNKAAAYNFADKNRNTQHRKMKSAVYNAIARYSTEDEVNFFLGHIENGNAESTDIASNALAVFIFYNQTNKSNDAINQLVALADNTSNKATSANAIAAIRNLHNYYYYQTFYMQTLMGMNKKYKSQFKAKLKESELVYKRLDGLVTKYGK